VTAAAIYPTPLTWLGIARELTAGSATLPMNTVLVTTPYEPEDTPEFLHDTNLRATQSALYGDTLGPEDSKFSYGGPAFLDTDGFWLDNILGDLSTVSAGTMGTPQNLSAALAIGATSLTVGVSLGSVTTGSVIQIADGAASEIVIATAGSAGTVVNFTGTPCRFAHTTAVTAALQATASNYTHTFAVLNNGSGLPPTHSLTDFTGITPTTGARTYPSACLAEMTYTGQAGNLLTRSVSGTGFLSAPAASAPTLNISAAAPVAGWRCSVTVGGAPAYNIGEWVLGLRRDLLVMWSAQGSQSPYVIARGNLTASLSLDYSVATSEAPLTALTSSAVPVTLSLSNGLAGASALAITVQMTQGQTVTSKPVRGSVVIGYSTGWDAIANATDVGGSGGLGPCLVTLTNAIATY
jgi:hypothetical protein